MTMNKFTFNDISITPAIQSNIDSRSECNPYHSDGFLPLFTAPMGSVVSLENYKLFSDNKIKPIIPRTELYNSRLEKCGEVWCAFSLTEFIELPFIDLLTKNKKIYVLIDIANGHMKKLHDSIRDVKREFGDKVVIMAGNVANPRTYGLLSEIGTDYVRVGIGSGSVCITSSNTGIHYPMGSLIKECYDISLNLSTPAKIIADGGIRGYLDIIKALALGADYVMSGFLFAKMLESAGKTFIYDNGVKTVVNQYSKDFNELYGNHQIFKTHYGMSTKKAQIEMGNEILKTSEGIVKDIPVEYTMEKWVKHFTDYLKTNMSYTSSRDLYDLIGYDDIIYMTQNSYNAINK